MALCASLSTAAFFNMSRKCNQAEEGKDWLSWQIKGGVFGMIRCKWDIVSIRREEIGLEGVSACGSTVDAASHRSSACCFSSGDRCCKIPTAVLMALLLLVHLPHSGRTEDEVLLFKQDSSTPPFFLYLTPTYVAVIGTEILPPFT